jgi:PAS domain-containing protein
LICSRAAILDSSVRHSFRSNNDNQYAARWLYREAPFCALAHNTDRDAIFIYGNKAAQACFEYTWDELTSLRSRLSAEEPNREERQCLLDAVKRHGFATGYRGLRIAKSGRRFWIENVTVWQLHRPLRIPARSRCGLSAVAKRVGSFR